MDNWKVSHQKRAAAPGEIFSRPWGERDSIITRHRLDQRLQLNSMRWHPLKESAGRSKYPWVSESEMRVLSKILARHPLTSKDILMQEAGEKVELFRNYYFVNYRTFEQNMHNEDYLQPANILHRCISWGHYQSPKRG